MIIFITGGVRSGKSTYAEQRAIELSKINQSHLYYIATSQIYDQEMSDRVKRHQREREKSGMEWHVIEKQDHVHELLPLFQKKDVILLDCVTTLLSNELYVFSEKNEKLWEHTTYQKEVEKKLVELFTYFARAPYVVIVVSNEVTYDSPSSDEDVVLYKRLLGRIHRKIVSLSVEAILVENGIPCIKKGG